MNESDSPAEQEDFSLYNGEGTNLRKAQMRLLEMLLEFDRICKKHGIEYFLSGGTCLGAVRHGGFIPWDDDVDIDVWHTDYERLMSVLPNDLSGNYFMQTDKTDSGFYRKYMRIVDKNSKVLYSDNTIREGFKFHGLWIDILPLEKTLSRRLKRIIDYLYSGSKKNIHINNRGLKKYFSYLVYPISWLLVRFMRWISTKLAPHEKICHVYGTSMAPKLKRSNCFPTKTIHFEGFEFLGPAKPHEYLVDLYGENYMALPAKNRRFFHSETIEIFDIEQV